MSMIKKLIALTLALAMVLSVSAFAGYKVDTYADASAINADCKAAVELMYALDIMTGNEKGEFMPEKAVTRAEMAKIIYVILNYGDDDKAVTYTGGNFFTDVEAGAWYEGYVNYCAATKLIAGRGNGTFDPYAAVTTAEAAKMLLTAIGYNAEARGYVGDKWSDNTLADANVIGLLDGYKANVNTAAPRQWIAVMLENALGALTYTNMAPAFSGLLTSGEDTTITTMGAKYYNLDSFSAVAIATDDVAITGDDTAEEGVLFAYEDGTEIKGTGLKAADLGQKYKVIYNTKNMTAYSVRSLGATATARFYDMDVEVKYATSTNKPSNKYVFTVDDMKATLNEGEVKYVVIDDAWTNDYVADAEDLRGFIESDLRAATEFKAIDSENDGDIDYAIVTVYTYGYVTEVSNSDKYGKYINIALAGTEDEFITYNGGENLYLKDCIISADEIEEEDIVKLSYDVDAEKIVVEVLPAAKGVEYKEYDDKNDIFNLGGKDYFIADTVDGEYNWKDTVEEYLLDEDYLGEKLNIVYDGDLVVYVWEDDNSYDNMDKVNEQLVLVIDAETQYSNGSIREKKAIEYMTIDGKTHVAVYVEKEGYATWEEIYALSAEARVYDVEGRLFKLYTSSKGVSLKALEDETINETLKVKNSVLNGYEEGSEYNLDATKTTIKIDDYKVAADNKYFVGAYSKGEAVYKVMTLSELKHCYDESAYGQILTYTNDKGTRTTVVGGYLFLELESELSADYLYVAKIGKITADGRKCDVVFSDGTTKSVVIENSTGLVEDVLYTYTYNYMDDNYTVEIVTIDVQEDEIVELDDDNVLWVSVDGAPAIDKAELAKEVIAVLTIKIDRDENQTGGNDMPKFKVVNKGIEFVALKDLKNTQIINNEDNKTYTQYTDYNYSEKDLFYVVNYQVMDTAQEIIDDLPYMLGYFFEEMTGAAYETPVEYNGAGFINGVQYFEVSADRKQFTVEIEDLAFEYSVEIQLCYGSEVLTTAVLNTEKYPAGEYEYQSGCILLCGESSSWTVAEWTPDTDKMPTDVKLIVDGVELDSAPVTTGATPDVGEPIYLTREVWAEIVAGLVAAE